MASQQWIVSVQCDLAGRYALPAVEYRIHATTPAVACRKAYSMFKRQPALSRKRLDNFRFRALRAGRVDIPE